MTEKEHKKDSHKSAHSHKSEKSESKSVVKEPVAEKNNPWIAWTIVLAVLLVISMMINTATIVLLMTQEGSSAAAPSQAPSAAPQAAPEPEFVDVSEDDDPVLGDPNAPITIIEFSDFECPFCARFYSDAYTQIKENYVDSGDVRIVYRDFPLGFHQRAIPAAIAAECAQEISGDEAFFDFHDRIFENQNDLSDANLRSHAVAIGLDVAAWDECFADADGSMAAEVDADFQDGQAAGVSGTPTVFINGKKIVGAQPYSVFEAEIEALLN